MLTHGSMLNGLPFKRIPASLAVRVAHGTRFPLGRRNIITLAIETSCDDTAVAILEKTTDGRRIGRGEKGVVHGDHAISQRPVETASSRVILHFNEKITARNTGKGGIVPLEALESHRANLSSLVARALDFLPDAGDRAGDRAGSQPIDTNPSALSSSSSSSSSSHTTHGSTSNGIDYDASKTLYRRDGPPKRKPDFLSVTRGPGMRSNLACGLDTAKGLSVAWGIPMVGVHHMQAHALTPRLVSALERSENFEWEDQTGVNGSGIDEGRIAKSRTAKSKTAGNMTVTPEFPFLTLLVSGGHTMLVLSKSLTRHEILATTQDVAVGDALDKCGRTLLPDHIKATATDTAYAKHLSKYAFPTPDRFDEWPVPASRAEEINKVPNRFGWHLVPALADTRELSFSFAGPASAIERIFQQRRGSLELDEGADERILLAQTALGIAFEHLGSRIIVALQKLRAENTAVSKVVVSGGVAANDFLRYFLRAMLDIRGFNQVHLIFPPVHLCTDNAAMVAWCGLEMYEAGFTSSLEIDALRKWSLDPQADDGGLLGIGGWDTGSTLASVS